MRTPVCVCARAHAFMREQVVGHVCTCMRYRSQEWTGNPRAFSHWHLYGGRAERVAGCAWAIVPLFQDVSATLKRCRLCTLRVYVSSCLC